MSISGKFKIANLSGKYEEKWEELDINDDTRSNHSMSFKIMSLLFNASWVVILNKFKAYHRRFT